MSEVAHVGDRPPGAGSVVVDGTDDTYEEVVVVELKQLNDKVAAAEVPLIRFHKGRGYQLAAEFGAFGFSGPESESVGTIALFEKGDKGIKLVGTTTKCAILTQLTVERIQVRDSSVKEFKNAMKTLNPTLVLSDDESSGQDKDEDYQQDSSKESAYSSSSDSNQESKSPDINEEDDSEDEDEDAPQHLEEQEPKRRRKRRKESDESEPESLAL